MPSAPLRPDESESLAALASLRILDTPPEAEFDALVAAAAIVCQVPISLVTLLDAKRQWFKASVGLDGAQETPRDVSFCSHALLGDGLLEVDDAREDLRFSDNPHVVGEDGIRFYVGVPLRLSDGPRVGALCVIDRRPRHLTITNARSWCSWALPQRGCSRPGGRCGSPTKRGRMRWRAPDVSAP